MPSDMEIEAAAKVIAAGDRDWHRDPPNEVEKQWRQWCEDDQRMFLRTALAALEAAESIRRSPEHLLSVKPWDYGMAPIDDSGFCRHSGTKLDVPRERAIDQDGVRYLGQPFDEQG